MKKFTLSLTLIIGFCGIAKSQNDSQNVAVLDTQYRLHSVERNQTDSRFNRRMSESSWYTFAQDYGNFNGLSYSGFVNFLFPDSCFIVYPDNELGRANTHVFGSMFDPKDVVFGSRAFSRWTDYTYDSLSWAQCYIRQVDSLDKVTQISASGTVTIQDFSTLSGAIFSIDGIDLTEGIDWDANTDNNTTANSLKTAISSLEVSGNALYTTNINGNEVEIISNTPGVSGNSITLNTSDAVNMTLSGSTLQGGGSSIQKIEIVDTLYIQHHTAANNALQLRTLTFQGDPATYFAGTPNIDSYQPTTLLNSSAFKTDTVFLTSEMRDSVSPDYSSFFSRRYSIAVGKDVVGSDNLFGNTIASSFIFKPMKSYSFNDTLISLMPNIVLGNKHNLMSISYFGQTGRTHRIVSNEAINNLFYTNSSLRYGQVGLGGWRSYAPFLSGFSGIYYHVTTESLNSTTPNANGYRLGDAYPNPTDNSEAFTIPFSLGASDMVTFTVTDITGKVVKTISNNFSTGENFVTIETSNLTSGIYIYTMTTGSFSGVGKVIVK